MAFDDFNYNAINKMVFQLRRESPDSDEKDEKTNEDDSDDDDDARNMVLNEANLQDYDPNL